MSNTTDCPNCRRDLSEHNNEKLQQCALNELAKINRKSKSFDLDSKSKSNGNRVGGSNSG